MGHSALSPNISPFTRPGTVLPPIPLHLSTSRHFTTREPNPHCPNRPRPALTNRPRPPDLRIGGDPVERLRIVITLLEPAFDEVAADRVVPGLPTREAELVAALAGDGSAVRTGDFEGVAAVRRGAPAQVPVTLPARGVGIFSGQSETSHYIKKM